MAVQKATRRPHTQARKEKVRQAIYARQAWVRETERLREAVDNDDEELARLLLKRLFRDRRREAA